MFVCCIFDHEGLQPSTSGYLLALHHLQITAGLTVPSRSDWPRYVLKGIQRSSPQLGKQRLPITSSVMRCLLAVWASEINSEFETRLLWAAFCLSFLYAGELTLESSSAQPSICCSYVAVDSHSSPMVLGIHLSRAKTDPFGRGITLFLGHSFLKLPGHPPSS